MISSKHMFAGLALVVASPLIPMSFAHANTCEWKDGNPGPIPYSIDIGTHYVPRDVPRSTPIGPVDRRYGPANGGGQAIDCLTVGPQIDFRARNNEPIVPGSFMINGEDSTGKIIKTNVDGIGVRVKLGQPYTSRWTTVGASFAVPYDAFIASYMPNVLSHSLLMPNITLVKTGNIDPGEHILNVSNLLSGEFTGVGSAFNLSVTGKVIQAECTVSTNPVSADPVDLGAWNLSEFTAIGHTTAAQPFSITLNSCVTDARLPAQTVTYAHIRLDPTAGSTIYDASAGQFTLGTGSTAKGVALQILHDDETAITLASEVKLKPIMPGTTTLLFKARLYQTAPPAPGQLEPGLAKGSLNFTITYL